jgi:uncharacterized RDD family membrane protein YckC
LYGVILLGKIQNNGFISFITAILAILEILFLPSYYIIFPLTPLRATPGQLLVGITIDSYIPGEPLTKKGLILRGITKTLSELFMYVFLVALFTKDNRALHDFVGRTRVVEPIYQEPSQGL